MEGLACPLKRTISIKTVNFILTRRMDTLTSVEVGLRGNKGACFCLVLPIIKVTYVSSCSFVVHVYHKFPGVKEAVSRQSSSFC